MTNRAPGCKASFSWNYDVLPGPILMWYSMIIKGMLESVRKSFQNTGFAASSSFIPSCALNTRDGSVVEGISTRLNSLSNIQCCLQNWNLRGTLFQFWAKRPAENTLFGKPYTRIEKRVWFKCCVGFRPSVPAWKSKQVCVQKLL